jgi:hypothetical protein
MSTNPMPPPIPMPPGGSDPDTPDPRLRDLPDPGTDEDKEEGTRPDEESPLSPPDSPLSPPKPDDENPDEQLPHWDSFEKS